MTEPSNTQTAAQGVRIFEESCCDSISYSLSVGLTDVNLKEFLAAVGTPPNKVEGYRANAHCSQKSEESDFHLHLSWRVSKEKFSLEIDYVAGKIKRPPNDTEPFAESYVAWVEQFFLTKKLDVRVDADFTYPTRQSKFPLPLKTSVGPRETELNVDGISFSLTGNPEGIEKVWLTQGATLRVHVIAQKSIDLRDMNPRGDIQVLSRVLDSVIEEKGK